MITEIAEGQLYSVEVKGKIRIRPHYYGKYSLVELTALPARILNFLMVNSDKMVTLDSIILSMWGDKKEIDQKSKRLLDVYIVIIRCFIKDCDVDVELLKTKNYFYLRTQPIKTLLN